MTVQQDFNPRHGFAVDLAPGLRRIVAPNPSPMTFQGTNTYLLGTKGLAVIDPGPDHQGHLNAILNAIASQQRVTHIFVTHSHLDHSPLAGPLSQITGAPVLAFGGATAGRSDRMHQLAQAGFSSGGEGIDTGFSPDITLADGQVIAGEGWSVDVIHTPGHLGNHICLGWQDKCFTADHVMGWATSLVSPPDGDLTDFMTSCDKLRAGSWHRFYPGHGDVVTDPGGRLDWLIAHRKQREASILEALQCGAATVAAITDRVYFDTPAPLKHAAARNVLAHLVDLIGKSRVSAQGILTQETVFSLAKR